MRRFLYLIGILVLASCTNPTSTPDGGSVAPINPETPPQPAAPPPEVKRAACPEGSALQGAAPPAGLEERCERPDGIRQGRATLWHESGAVAAEGKYKDGLKDGPWLYWHPTGQKASAGQYQQGARTGRWTFWHENGQMAEEGDYRAGKEDGVWLRWDEQGAKTSETRYENGWPKTRKAL